MTTPKRKPVFIEKIMPVTLLNEQVYYEPTRSKACIAGIRVSSCCESPVSSVVSK